jgi:16S rRNA (guanine527-N7)-methyltransferase
MARLDAYAALLGEWQSRMNLVAASTLGEVWQRHFADSAQLAVLAEATAAATWLDIGSGAGFPALVLAVLCPGTFHLVESRAKKCAFLEAAATTLGVADRVVIHNARIEDLPPFAADFVTARAAASLAQLFDWGLPFGRDARWLLPKGRSVAAEVAAAAVAFRFDHDLIPSRTDPDARIVVAQNVRRRRP